MSVTIFDEGYIGKKKTDNRLVAQAMEANDGENGGVSQRAIERYEKLAEGEWGVIVVEALSISETSLARKNGMIINRKNLDGFKRLVEACRKKNEKAIILFQITHSGRKSGDFSECVSIVPNSPKGRVLTTDEIEEIKNRFIEGVLLAEEAGADGIDYKMCHGYFGAEMLRPENTRDDKWGGSMENRLRFLREGVEGIKSSLKSDDFILGSRLSMYEAIRGGCGTNDKDEVIEELSEMDEVVKEMNRLNMDYVNVSAGIPGYTSEITRPTKPSKYIYLHHFRYARRVRELLNKISSPMKAIGSAYTILAENMSEYANENLSKGYVDFVGLGRQTFADPLTPKKLKNGEKVNYCTACSGCSRLMVKQINDGCIIFNDYYKSLIKNA